MGESPRVSDSLRLQCMRSPHCGSAVVSSAGGRGERFSGAMWRTRSADVNTVWTRGCDGVCVILVPSAWSRGIHQTLVVRACRRGAVLVPRAQSGSSCIPHCPSRPPYLASNSAQQINAFADQVVEQRQKALREKVVVQGGGGRESKEGPVGGEVGGKGDGDTQRHSSRKHDAEDNLTLGHSDILSR